jgi:hypothetical protein
VALQEVLLLVLAPGCRVEVVMETVLQLPHEEVARVRLAVDSDLWVGHVIIQMSCKMAYNYHLGLLQAEASSL